MKITMEIDCTPEEARAFLGLPDLGGAQQAYAEEFQRRMMEALAAMDPQALANDWLPEGTPGWEQWMKLWQPGGDADKS